MSEVEVRVVDAVDEAGYSAIARLLPQLSSGSLPSLEQVRAVVADPNSTLLLAEARNEVTDEISTNVLGMLTLATVTLLAGRAAHIEDVVVDETARGAGVGRMLVERALEIAARQGARHVDLTSRPGREAANRLYQRVGFELRETNAYRFTVRR